MDKKTITKIVLKKGEDNFVADIENIENRISQNSSNLETVKQELSNKYDTILSKVDLTGIVKSVNSIKPDIDGNVNITGVSGNTDGSPSTNYVRSVNNISPDIDGNVNITGVSGNTGKSLDIGEMGRPGFGVGFPDATEDELAQIGLAPMHETYDKTSDNYGNFMSDFGGVFVFIPHFFVRYGSEKSSVYETYGVNSIDIKRHQEYATEAAANADGYFTPRGFYDGSSTQWKQGVFIQKYEPFAKAVGGVNYPYGDGTAYGWVNIAPPDMMTAAKKLGPDYHVATAFTHEVAEIILIAQAQHAICIANCAWWQSKGGANYPMQWNAATPENYSHNGQKNGIMMISDCRWEFAPGITTAGTSATQEQIAVTNNDLYVLKPEIKAKDITNGFGGETDAWGTSSSLLNIYDKIDVTDHFLLTTSRMWYWGNGNTRMFMQPIGEDGLLIPHKRDLFMLVPDSNNSVSAAATTAMGPCRSYNSPTTQNLALYLHGQNNNQAGAQSVFSRFFRCWRTYSYVDVSFRCGVYLRD